MIFEKILRNVGQLFRKKFDQKSGLLEMSDSYFFQKSLSNPQDLWEYLTRFTHLFELLEVQEENVLC